MCGAVVWTPLTSSLLKNGCASAWVHVRRFSGSTTRSLEICRRKGIKIFVIYHISFSLCVLWTDIPLWWCVSPCKLDCWSNVTMSLCVTILVTHNDIWCENTACGEVLQLKYSAKGLHSTQPASIDHQKHFDRSTTGTLNIYQSHVRILYINYSEISLLISICKEVLDRLK